LLQRVENQELAAYTSLHLVAEVAHKMMTIEANRILGWPFAGMANRLRRHPSEVQRLTLARLCVDAISRSRVQVVSPPMSALVAATGISQQSGLLINDALLVAIMQQQGLTRLASHDADFDRVPGITRYAPA
jgi:predicted nucleic acid-binding protein